VLALSACHSPYDWPPDGTHSLDAKWPLGSGVLWEHYRAMLESVDHQLGELLFSLGDALDNTLVIVLGDNGTPTSVLESAREEGQDLGLYESVVDNHRFKGSCYEPGTRVPFLASGPMVVKPGRSSAELIDVVDLHATIRELAAGSGIQATSPGGLNRDSHSFARLLRDPDATSLRDFSLAELFNPNGDYPSPPQADRGFAAPVLGDGLLYKLVRRAGERDEVYDLTNDPLERVDLGLHHPAYPKLASRLESLVGN
jgi:arylsulfatase A-like enzyme